MIEKHWRVVADVEGRVIIDRDPNGTTWEILETYDGYWVDIALSPTGELYGLDENRVLHTIDLETGATHAIGATGLATGNAFDIDALGNAYVSEKDGGFYRIDLATGAVDKISDTAGSAGDLKFVDGELWMSTKRNTLVKIDPETGASSGGFGHDIANITGLSEGEDGFLAYARHAVYRIDLEARTLTKIEEFRDTAGLEDMTFVLGAATLPTRYFLPSGAGSASAAGSYDVDLIGNGLDNVLHGNAGENVLLGEAGRDVLYGEGGDDDLLGGSRRDRLAGGEGADALSGGSGGDRIFGEAGEDHLVGGPGGNRLVGGLDADVLVGGSGADLFRFVDAADSLAGVAHDLIEHFQSGHDAIDLSRIDANSLSGKDNAFDFIGGHAFSGDAGELRYKAGVLRADVDGDGHGDFAVHFTAGDRPVLDDLML